MQNEKGPKKLNAEELEKRVARAALTFDTGTDPVDSGKGSKAGGKDAPPPPT